MAARDAGTDWICCCQEPERSLLLSTAEQVALGLTPGLPLALWELSFFGLNPAFRQKRLDAVFAAMALEVVDVPVSDQGDTVPYAVTDRLAEYTAIYERWAAAEFCVAGCERRAYS